MSDRFARVWLLLVLGVGLSACSSSLHEPTVSHGARWESTDWRIHCETARTHAESDDPTVADHKRWLYARDDAGYFYSLEGRLVDGFLEVDALRAPGVAPAATSRIAVRELCRQEVERTDGPLLLGQVMAARPGENVDLPPVYDSDTATGGPVSRLVIFGDSLTDTGRLKRRMRIFPSSPYWLGRFSNGPAWPEYLAAATGLAVQNHAYGGASASHHDALPGANLYARVHDGGQFFVSGTLGVQVADYIDGTLGGARIERADATAFLIWAGANDYISKEPITGLINTFLNSPEGESGYREVVEEVVAQLAFELKALYSAGARRFLLLDLPDLGRTPIVLQNTTYTPEFEVESESARRLELARRLTQLTLYHNRLLAAASVNLRAELPDSEILLVSAYAFFDSLNGASDTVAQVQAEHGYDPQALRASISYGSHALHLQQRCYTGPYLAVRDKGEVCPQPQQAMFWDTIHPSTLTHCWQAWSVGDAMAQAGWIRPLPSHADYLPWCRSVVQQATTGAADSFWLVPPARQ